MREKRIIAGLLAMSFVFGGAVLPCAAESNSIVVEPTAYMVAGNITYEELDDGTIEIRHVVYGTEEKDFVIPKEIDGKVVSRIGEFAFQSDSITSISIPDTVTSIGKYAFNDCRDLKEIVIPDSVTYIGICAFGDCFSLEKVHLSENLKTLENFVFQNCNSLKEINFPASVNSIGARTFSGCSFTEVNIPDNIISIDQSAFEHNELLKSVTLPDTLKYLSFYVFSYCTELEKVVLPKGMTDIPDGTFYHDKKLTNIILPDSVKTIGMNSFMYSGLTDIVLPEGVTSIESSAFACCEDLKDITIPESVTKIDGNIFIYQVKGEYKLINLPGLIIHCYSGSYAEEFALSYGYDYMVIGNYPEPTKIEYNTVTHQFRLTWSAVEGADKYGIAAFIAGKWRVQTYTDKTTFTSPKLKAGDTYKLLIAARVNGEWDLSDFNKIVFTVTVK